VNITLHVEWDDMERDYRAYFPEFPDIEARGRTRYDAQMAIIYPLANAMKAEQVRADHWKRQAHHWKQLATPITQEQADKAVGDYFADAPIKEEEYEPPSILQRLTEEPEPMPRKRRRA
jgi:hypothetical protein